VGAGMLKLCWPKGTGVELEILDLLLIEWDLVEFWS